jgi:hypothetical protein
MSDEAPQSENPFSNQPPESSPQITPPVLPSNDTPPSTPFPGGSFPSSESSKTPGFPTTPFKEKKKEKAKNPFQAGMQKQKILSFIAVCSLAILVIGGVYWFIAIYNRSGLLILDTGENITITLNGKLVNTTKKDKGLFISASAGSYKLTITKNSYLPFTQNIRLGRGITDEIRPVFTLLKPTLTEGTASSTIDFVRPSSDQSTIFYLGNQRTIIYRMDINNLYSIPLTSHPLNGITDINWSWNPDLALVTMADGVYLQEIPYYNFVTQTMVKIGGPEIVSPVWDPNNSGRFAFAYFPSTGESSLIFTDKYMRKLDRKANINGIPNPKLVWSSDSSEILLLGRSADSSQNNIWLYDTTQGTLKQITQGGGILDASFSPSGDYILIEKLSNVANSPLSTSLSYIDVTSNQVTPLNIAGKVAKAAWKNDTSFYLPDVKDNNLLLTTLSNSIKQTAIPFSFANSLTIEGMYYYPSTHTLIFYTSDSIYAVSLALE